MALWLKLYARDSDGVMRAVPGIKLTHQGTLWIATSVYAPQTEHNLGNDWFLFKQKAEDEWGYGQ